MIPILTGQPGRNGCPRAIAVVLDRVHAPVGQRQQPGLADRRGEQRVGRADVDVALVAGSGRVLLVGPDDDRRVAGVVDVGHRRRVDDLALVLVEARVGVDVAERDVAGHRVDRRDLVRIRDQHREPGHRLAVRVPGVDVAVLARGDHVHPVAVERWPAPVRSAKPPSTRSRTPCRTVWNGLSGAPEKRRGRVHVEDEMTMLVPGVDVALVVVGDDLEPSVAEQVAGGERPEHGRVVPGADAAVPVGELARVQREPRGVHRPARELVPIRPVRVDPAVRGGDDRARCGCRRRGRRAAARSRRRRAAGSGSRAASARRGAGTAGGGPRRSSPGPTRS